MSECQCNCNPCCGCSCHNKWIKCSDRLPDIFVDVLVRCKCKQESSAFTEGELYCAIDSLTEWSDGFEKSFRSTRFDHAEVTHWMPLPKPPEGF
jgi:hypothetical protein